MVKKIYCKSKKLYYRYINSTLDENVAKRYCNFKLQEDKSYNSSKHS